jgi:hypothetical protein
MHLRIVHAMTSTGLPAPLPTMISITAGRNGIACRECAERADRSRLPELDAGLVGRDSWRQSM